MPYFGIPIRNGLPIGLGSVAGFGVQQFSPADLFSAGEQGAWYDPSDFSTLFTDSAGTTPVTAVEQFVGLMLDKSKGGVGTNGPQRYNLLTRTEEFDNAAWTKVDATVTQNAAIAPDGTTTADALFEAATTGAHFISQGPATAAAQYKYSIYIKANGRTRIAIFGTSSYGGGLGNGVFFDVGTGQYISGGTGTPSITDKGNGWWLVTYTWTAAAFGGNVLGVFLVDTGTNTVYVGDPTKGVYLWGADLRLASQANLAPTYQPITASWSATIPGNHAFQTTSAKRPKLAARYNLLTYSEEFDDGYWSKDNVTVTANTNATTDPLGGNTADLITENASTALHRLNRSNAVTIAASCKVSLSFKAGTARYVYLEAYSGTPIGSLGVDLSDGSRITLTDTPMAPTYAIINQGNGWWKLEVTFTAVGANTGLFFGTASGPGGTRQTTGSQTFYIWGADLRPASQATGLIGPTYQRVAAATVYDTAGFLPYLAFDGLSWSMGTNSINPGAVDKAQVFAGVRKLSDAAQAAVAEFSATIASNNGTFLLAAPNGANDNYNFSSKGTTLVNNTIAGFAAPATNVVTGLGDIAAPTNLLRVNGIQVGVANTSQGTGNYLTYPLFIGARNQASLFFNGWLTSLIVRFGPNMTAAQIDQTESWIEGKTFGKDMIVTYVDELLAADNDNITAADGDQIYMTTTYT